MSEYSQQTTDRLGRDKQAMIKSQAEQEEDHLKMRVISTFKHFVLFVYFHHDFGLSDELLSDFRAAVVHVISVLPDTFFEDDQPDCIDRKLQIAGSLISRIFVSNKPIPKDPRDNIQLKPARFNPKILEPLYFCLKWIDLKLSPKPIELTHLLEFLSVSEITLFGLVSNGKPTEEDYEEKTTPDQLDLTINLLDEISVINELICQPEFPDNLQAFLAIKNVAIKALEMIGVKSDKFSFWKGLHEIDGDRESNYILFDIFIMNNPFAVTFLIT